MSSSDRLRTVRTSDILHVQLTAGPAFMIGGFLAELLSQVVEPLQPSNLCQEPLLVALLCLLQALPGTSYVLWTQCRS